MFPLIAARTVVASTCVSFRNGELGECRIRCLVFLSQRELDVDSGEKCENVSLKHGHQQFEQREDEAEREGARAEELESAVCREEEELGGGEEKHQQQVADDHVHHQSKRQG